MVILYILYTCIKRIKLQTYEPVVIDLAELD